MIKKIFYFVLLLVIVTGVFYVQTYYDSYLSFGVALLSALVSSFTFTKISKIYFYFSFISIVTLSGLLNAIFGDMPIDYHFAIYISGFYLHWHVGVFLVRGNTKIGVKLALFILLFTTARLVHIDIENETKEIPKLDLSAYFVDLHPHDSSTSVPVPNGSFFMFTWNQRCGQCKMLARFISEIPLSQRLPTYATHVSFRVDEDFEHVPKSILGAVKNESYLLSAKQESKVYKEHRLAPVIFYYNRAHEFNIIRGFGKHNMDLVEAVIKDEELSFWQTLFPRVFFEKGSMYIYLLSFVFFLIITLFPISGKSNQGFRVR